MQIDLVVHHMNQILFYNKVQYDIDQDI